VQSVITPIVLIPNEEKSIVFNEQPIERSRNLKEVDLGGKLKKFERFNLPLVAVRESE
jgi:hypothetical protein